jgi:hypothetical protein
MKFRIFWDVLPCSQMSTDVSEVRAASIIRALKRRYTSTVQHDAISQKADIFILSHISTRNCFKLWKRKKLQNENLFA